MANPHETSQSSVESVEVVTGALAESNDVQTPQDEDIDNANDTDPFLLAPMPTTVTISENIREQRRCSAKPTWFTAKAVVCKKAFNVEDQSRWHPDHPLKMDNDVYKKKSRKHKTVGPDENHEREGNLKDMFRRTYGFDDYTSDVAVLVIKLALSVNACGMPTYIAEPILAAMADSCGLPRMNMTQGYRELNVSFGGGPTLSFPSRQSKVLHRLSLLHKLTLAAALSAGRIDVKQALALADDINEKASPYGQAIQTLAHIGFSCAAAMAIFGGGPNDIYATLLCKLVVTGIMVCVKKSESLASHSDLIEPFFAGFFAPMVIFANVAGFQKCMAARVFLSVMVIEFPGADLLFGVTELYRGAGSAVVGGSRLMVAVVYTMFLAVCLTVGWTLSAGIVDRWAGHTSAGPFDQPWTVPDHECTNWRASEGVVLETLGANVAALVPLVICFNVIVGTGLREIPFAGTLVMLTLLLSWVLNNLGLPSPAPVINTAVLFFGANCAFFYEYLTSRSHMLVLVPSIALLAPGAGVFRNVLSSIDGSETKDAWFELLMIGTSYCVGETIAHYMWARALAKKATSSAMASARNLSVDGDVDMDKVASMQRACGAFDRSTVKRTMMTVNAAAKWRSLAKRRKSGQASQDVSPAATPVSGPVAAPSFTGRLGLRSALAKAAKAPPTE